MGIGWASCPICGRVFEGSYFPDTGANTAEYMVQRHAILRHCKKITDNGIVDAKIPDDFFKVSETKTYIAGTTGNVRLKRDAYITCVCGRFFIINFEEARGDEGKIIRVVVREYSDDCRHKKISELTEVIEVGHVSVDKFAKLWEQTWESTKEDIIRNHLLEHGIYL